MKLNGNTILITGGSSGIGLGLAQKFIELDNTVIVTGRNMDRLNEAKQKLPKLHVMRCDAAAPEALHALANKIAQEHPALNVLINNAGVMRFKNLGQVETDLADLTLELDINLAGPIRTVAVLVDRLKANRGTIINVSSGLAYVPLGAAPIYCATKAALHSYTISLRQQLARSGVEVIELAPPAVKTNLAQLPEDEGIKVMSTDELVAATIRGLRSGAREIRPGQANQLHWMSRLAPNFIAGQLAKGSEKMIPQT